MDHEPEMLKCFEERPDQTAKELLVEFQVRYPGFYKASIYARYDVACRRGVARPFKG